MTKFNSFKYHCIRHKFYRSTHFIAFSDFLDISVRYTSLVSLKIFFSVFVDRNFQSFAQCIDDRSSDTMKTSRYLVCSFIEFSSCMKDSENSLQSGFSCFFMLINRNTSSIIMDSHRSVFIETGGDSGTMTSQRFIYRIIYNFLDKMMQTFGICGSDIHSWSHSDGFESFQNLNVGGIIVF